ncbi:MAG: hypothetical protein K2N29_07970 [Ruminiclostridium sp.]|nr:hypothetical protein [Ruminiclostridium sp.]
MAEGYITAGTTFKIGNTKIEALTSTPDMGSEPDKVDITTFDNEKYMSYIPGLMDPGSLTFEFVDKTSNFNAAYNAEGKTNTYEVSFPDGSKYTWSGTHRTYKLSASVGDRLNFAVSCTPSTELEYTPGSTSAITD